MEKNSLLSDYLADDQEPLIGLSPSHQKACTTGCQGIDADEIVLEIAKLLADRFTDLVNSGPLLFSHGKKIFSSLCTVCSLFMTKESSDLRMHPIDQCLG